MKPIELLTTATKTIAVAGAIYGLSQHAFAKKTRKEIGRRDRWTCQISGKMWRDGWNMQAAHNDMSISPRNDTNPNHGRMLCTGEHVKEHIRAGQMNEAYLLYAGHTFRNYNWIHQHGYDEKPEFQELVNTAWDNPRNPDYQDITSR